MGRRNRERVQRIRRGEEIGLREWRELEAVAKKVNAAIEGDLARVAPKQKRGKS